MYLSFFFNSCQFKTFSQKFTIASLDTSPFNLHDWGIRGNAQGENNWEIMRVTKGEYPFKPLHIVVVHLYANGAKLKKGIIQRSKEGVTIAQVCHKKKDSLAVADWKWYISKTIAVTFENSVMSIKASNVTLFNGDRSTHIMFNIPVLSGGYYLDTVATRVSFNVKLKSFVRIM